MAKIIRINQSRKRPRVSSHLPQGGCDHKQVIAYTLYRTVNCAICGAQLDPFDVLVDMIKGYVPPQGDDHEGKKLNREVEKRRQTREKKEKPE